MNGRVLFKKTQNFFFVETPSNPLTEVTDIKALSKIAHQKDIKLVVDNCFCSPALQKPLLFGADIIIHSATKYIDGQGRCLGGAVLADKKNDRADLSIFKNSRPYDERFQCLGLFERLRNIIGTYGSAF